MKRVVSMLMVTMLAAAMATPAFAQMQPAPTTSPMSRPPVEKKIEGTVTKIDPAAKTVQVSSGFLGIMGAKLQVTDDTRIQANGKDVTIAEIQEGARVKASYERQEGRNLAKSIEVQPAEEKKTPAASPSPTSGSRY